jgi:hypothetical protein
MKTLIAGVLAAFVSAPTPAPAAQSQTTHRTDAEVKVVTMDELRRELSPGDFISVVQVTGDSVKGRLRHFGDTDLEIQAETQVTAGVQRRQRREITLPISSIRSLERPGDPSANGALIGAGAGASLAITQFIWAAAVDYNEIDEWGPTYLAMGAICTGLGALAGWAIDRTRSKPRIRFDSPSAPTTMTIRATPLLSRGPGIGLVVSF